MCCHCGFYNSCCDGQVNAVVNTLWHQLWIAEYPEYSFLTKGNLYSRFIYHSKVCTVLFGII
jgi:hypothetical protein